MANPRAGAEDESLAVRMQGDGKGPRSEVAVGGLQAARVQIQIPPNREAMDQDLAPVIGVLLNPKRVLEGVALEFAHSPVRLGHAASPDARSASAVELLEHGRQAVGLRHAMSLCDEDVLAGSRLGPEVEELVLVATRSDDPPIMVPEQRSHRPLEPSVLPGRQSQDLKAVRLNRLAGPGPHAFDPCSALVRERQEHRDSRKVRHAPRVYARA